MLSDEQRQRMAAKAGTTSSSFPRYDVPRIDFNGNTGEFRSYSQKDGQVPLPKKISVVILKKRNTLREAGMGELWSSDYSSPSSVVALFKKEGTRSTFVENGTPSDLRTKYPTLKTQNPLYVLYEGQVYLLTVKGGSMSGFIAYQDTLRDANKHSFEVFTTISSKKETSTKMKGKAYYAMQFTNDEFPKDFDFANLEEKFDEVENAVTKQDAYQSSKLAQSSAPIGGATAPAKVFDNGNVWDDTATDKDEIPF